MGAFDHKLELESVSQPLDFYENYRSLVGVKRETMWGGEVFAGYRIGRGYFEPWYLERETNKGGEFKAGITAPLVGDRWIDENRSQLWQAQLERRRVEPMIYGQVIQYVRDGSVAYWNWVAAGANQRIAQGLLDLAVERNKGLKAQVEAQEKAPIDLVDNRRMIVSRESKLIEAQRKLQQAAVKLSLFYRTAAGEPLLADQSLLPKDVISMDIHDVGASITRLRTDDIQLALSQRPELAELQIVRQQLDVAERQARNETLPNVDGGLLVSQDVGAPTSPKKDKSQLKLEAMLTVSVPVERRKATGKIRSLRAKLAQVSAKNQFAADKVVAEVRFASAALDAARERLAWAAESYKLALEMQNAEKERFNLGQSTLFNLNIREEQTAAAAAGRVDALYEYAVAKADYIAALGFDRPPF
ncbi:MAG: TolC family protein [Pirellulales bacterium]